MAQFQFCRILSLLAHNILSTLIAFVETIMVWQVQTSTVATSDQSFKKCKMNKHSFSNKYADVQSGKTWNPFYILTWKFSYDFQTIIDGIHCSLCLVKVKQGWGDGSAQGSAMAKSLSDVFLHCFVFLARWILSHCIKFVSVMFWHHAIFLRCNHDLMNLQDPFTADSLRREDGPVAIDDDELNRVVMFEPVKFSNRDGSASVGVADDLNTALSSSDRVFSECRKNVL